MRTHSIPIKNLILSGCLMASLGLLNSCQGDHYEKILRKQFDLPSEAHFFVIEDSFGDGFKENLQFKATFEFTDIDFNIYQKKVATAPDWHPLPISQSELKKITGDQFIKTERPEQKTQQGDSKSKPPINNNETRAKARARARWHDTLYLGIKNGYYHCLTAGTDIMYSLKVPCSKKSGRFNDLLLGVLDIDNKTLHIRAYTGY